MEILYTKTDLTKEIINLRSKRKSIGFVPTMGALHNGHLSLIEFSKSDSDITVASIFVNPTQFNDAEDLKNYPRNLGKDLEMLDKSGCDVVFVPSVMEMYPEPDKRIFDFGNLDKVMEGRFRPGHFNGVAQIVSKLFYAVNADKAYFGRKDFQQVAIVKRLVEILGLSVKIVSCDIIREMDGLAMSSRNSLLSMEQRNVAPLIFKTLNSARELISKYSIEELKKWVENKINTNQLMQIDYFEIVDETSLQPVINWDKTQSVVACIAVKVGKIRLIDNLKLN